MQHGELRYFSTFSGIGGFELGLERAVGIKRTNEKPRPSELEIQQRGERPPLEEEPSVLPSDIGQWRSVRCVGYSEIDRYASTIYQSHFPTHPNYGDITKIDPQKLPDFDLFVGGFPCQAFSVAGLRRGFGDTRGTLFFEITRICAVKRPRLLLLENVKGLLSHDAGHTFTTIISTLDELGYDLQWQVLNSKDFGVPQNRERVLIVGHLRGTPRPEVFPFTGADIEDTRHVGEDLSYPFIQPFITDPQGRLNKVCTPSPISPTLRANTHDNQPVVNTIRRLTPTECERLQGFPDGWTEGVSDTQRYKCCGNAVTVNVIEAVAMRLLL